MLDRQFGLLFGENRTGTSLQVKYLHVKLVSLVYQHIWAQQLIELAQERCILEGDRLSDLQVTFDDLKSIGKITSL
jgi:hypothetical protein